MENEAFSMLTYLGPKVSTDPVLLVKVTRIARAFFKEVHESSITFVLSMTLSQCGISFYHLEAGKAAKNCTYLESFKPDSRCTPPWKT